MDCQLVHICDCTPAGIQEALAELPETLDETYARALQGIKKAKWAFAHRMFQFISVASRPLRVKELAELIAFDFKAGPIPRFYEDWRLENPADAVLSTCSTLLAIVDDQGSPVIQFSHFSVKEFLTSTRLAEATDITSRRYHVSMISAHTLAAQACLGILLHLDNDVTSDSVEDFPLAKYAAEHWLDHARFEGVSQNVEDGMKQLFDPSKPHLAICVWMHDLGAPSWKRITRSETPLPLPRTSLHYAASWGLYPVVEFLIIKYPHSVYSRDLADSATPLHAASRKGHMKTACKLIERGADLTARDNKGRTPLHAATGYSKVDVARMLIGRGADVTAQNKDGETPLHLASRIGHVDAPRMLIENGADLTALDNNGETPLHLASKIGYVDLVRMFIERGADPTALNNDGETPLHLASGSGQVDIARMLIESGVDLTARDKDGGTPLHSVASSFWAKLLPEKYAEVAHMLLEHGADVNARNKYGVTPFFLALQRGDAEIVHILEQYGADSGAHNNTNWISF